MTLGKDVYKNYAPGGKETGVLPLVSDLRVLEIGFGSCALLRALAANGNDVYGVDAGLGLVENAKAQGFANVFHVDVSEEPLPFADDFFDAVYCYEVFEHLTNPHRMFFEIRRVLKPKHKLYFSVPAQEVDMGYGVQRHTFVYPGLLERENLERFFMQMYFRIEGSLQAGPHDHLIGRNYLLNNMKSPEKADVVQVITQDVSVIRLYDDVLSPEDLDREIDRELTGYLRLLEDCVEKGRPEIFRGILQFVARNYPDEYEFYLDLARRLMAGGHPVAARESISVVISQKNVPLAVLEAVKGLLQDIVASADRSDAT